jgi:hypothetical protein
MTSPVLAQPVPAAAGVPAARVREADRRGGEADDRARREAALVELGWGADPRTFACRLTAHPVGGAVEVRGYVPNEATRLHALAIAHASTALAVVDQLTVYPNLSQRKDGDFGYALRQGALTLLAGAFPDQAGAFLVCAQPDGQVTVSGTVRTLDDKVAVSRRLRSLAGCTCVINELDVNPGAAALPPQVAPRPTALPAPVARTANNLPAPGPVVPRVAPPPAVMQTAFQTPAPLPQPPPANTEATPAAWAGVVPEKQATAPSPEPEPNRAVPAPSDPPAGGYVSTGVLLHKRAEVPANVTPTTAEAAPPAVVSAPAVVRPPAVEQVIAPEPPAPPAAPRPVAESALPYVSSGTMVVARAAPPSAPVSTVPVAALKRRIEGVCGRSAHDIQVVPLAENKLEVRLKVASIADGGRLSAKIMGIKELARYRVSFQVRVDP